VERVKLYYTKNGGVTWKLITRDGYNGYPWWVSPVQEPREKCKVKVILLDSEGNPIGSGVSEDRFTIKPRPP